MTPEERAALRKRLEAGPGLLESHVHWWAEVGRQVPALLDELDRLHAQAESDAGWHEAIDWLLNSRHTGDPDIQAAFWALSDGLCTREEADSGYMADGRTVLEMRNAKDWGPRP